MVIIIIIIIIIIILVSAKLHADLTNCDCLSIYDLFDNFRLDIAICSQKEIVILELTVCHETNLLKSRSYKVNKYCNISDYRKTHVLNRTGKVFTCEVSTLGFISDTSSRQVFVRQSNCRIYRPW